MTGAVHINTQKDDVKVSKIILEVTGTLATYIVVRKKDKDKQYVTVEQIK